MKPVTQAASLGCIGLGIFFIVQGVRLRIQGELGPGPGFFPFGIGLGLAALGAVWLVQASLRPAAGATVDWPAPLQALRLAGILGAMAGFMLLLRPLGFPLAMLALLLALGFLIDRRYPLTKLAVAIAGSFGVHYVFEQLLRVPLPYADLPWLQRLGF